MTNLTNKQMPIFLVIFTLYLFQSFELRPNYLLLHSRTPLKEHELQFWLRSLCRSTGKDFYLKPEENSFALFCASDPDYFGSFQTQEETLIQ